jgi:hypothetical protein
MHTSRNKQNNKPEKTKNKQQTYAGKRDGCRMLARIAGKVAVPANTNAAMPSTSGNVVGSIATVVDRAGAPPASASHATTAPTATAAATPTTPSAESAATSGSSTVGTISAAASP